MNKRRVLPYIPPEVWPPDDTLIERSKVAQLLGITSAALKYLEQSGQGPPVFVKGSFSTKPGQKRLPTLFRCGELRQWYEAYTRDPINRLMGAVIDAEWEEVGPAERHRREVAATLLVSTQPSQHSTAPVSPPSHKPAPPAKRNPRDLVQLGRLEGQLNRVTSARSPRRGELTEPPGPLPTGPVDGGGWHAIEEDEEPFPSNERPRGRPTRYW
jgi:hypothetical protein